MAAKKKKQAERHEHVVFVRLTPAEYRAIARVAEQRGAGIGPLARELLTLHTQYTAKERTVFRALEKPSS